MKSVMKKAETLHLRIIQTLIKKGVISQQEAHLFDVPMVHVCQNVALVRALDEQDTVPAPEVRA